MDGHTRSTLSKCKRCKKRIYVCQVGIHGKGRGWRICHVPCSCGPEHYPSTAKGARPLETTAYASSHPEYEPLPGAEGASQPPSAASAPLPAENPIYVELTRNGDRLEFNGHDGEPISTFREHWQPASILYQGVDVGGWQMDDDTGVSYFTWTLDVGDRQGAEAGQSERSLRKRVAHASMSASHGRTLSAESLDPLQWDQERIDAETVTSGMAGLTVAGESSRQADNLTPGPVEPILVTAQLNSKGMVVFEPKSGGNKLRSLRSKWVQVEGGFIFESVSEGCTFFAKEIKPVKK